MTQPPAACGWSFTERYFFREFSKELFFNSVMYTFTFSGELWVAHTGREPSEFRGSKVKIAKVKMKVAILRSENRSKVPGETCFDRKYFQKQEMEPGLKYLDIRK